MGVPAEKQYTNQSKLRRYNRTRARLGGAKRQSLGLLAGTRANRARDCTPLGAELILGGLEIEREPRLHKASESTHKHVAWRGTCLYLHLHLHPHPSQTSIAVARPASPSAAVGYPAWLPSPP